MSPQQKQNEIRSGKFAIDYSTNTFKVRYQTLYDPNPISC